MEIVDYLIGKKSGGGQEINNQEKTATPTTTSQEITADSGYTGLSKVTINGVDSSIDQNIVSSNIKNGVSILGVQGNYTTGAYKVNSAEEMNALTGMQTGDYCVIDGEKGYIIPSELTFSKFSGSLADIQSQYYKSKVFLLRNKNYNTKVVSFSNPTQFVISTATKTFTNDEITLETETNKGIIFTFDKEHDYNFKSLSNKYIQCTNDSTSEGYLQAVDNATSQYNIGIKSVNYGNDLSTLIETTNKRGTKYLAYMSSNGGVYLNSSGSYWYLYSANLQEYDTTKLYKYDGLSWVEV